MLCNSHDNYHMILHELVSFFTAFFFNYVVLSKVKYYKS